MKIPFYAMILWVTTLLMLSLSTFADDFFVRPHTGIGYMSTSNDSGASFHIGSRFLLTAGSDANKYYGLEVTYIDADAFGDNKSELQYLGVGIVPEN
jgi:hypothetical protein